MSTFPFKLRTLGAAACVAATLAVAACSSGGSSGANSPGVLSLTVAPRLPDGESSKFFVPDVLWLCGRQ